MSESQALLDHPQDDSVKAEPKEEKVDPSEIMTMPLERLIGNNMSIITNVSINGSKTETTEFLSNSNFRQIKFSSINETITISWQSNKPYNYNSAKPISEMIESIAKLRAEGMTQQEVARILGTTQANISKIERNAKEQAKSQKACASPISACATE